MLRLSDKAVLYHADCRDALRLLPDNSIDSCVTDPPYALVSIVKRFGLPNAAPAKGNDAYMRASSGFMGKAWDTGEVAFSEDFWREVLRVLKPGAHVAAFGASRGYHRMACAIEDAGFEIRDSLMWVYGTGFPKSQDVSKFIDKAAGAERATPNVEPMKKKSDVGEISKNVRCTICGKARASGNPCVCPRPENVPVTDAAREWEGWGTALKPAFEPIVLARKPLSEGTVAANVLRWRTGALNIDGCRVGNAGGCKSDTAYVGGDAQNTFGKGLNDQRSPSVEGLGRWPANVVHDGSDEVVALFPSQAGAAAPVHKRNADKFRNAYGTFKGNVDEAGSTFRGDSGSAARFFYSAKASKADRAGSKHPTVKPISLMEWLAELVTPPGGTILDPFAGSGTTGAAARNKGFACILVEREAEYAADIRRRLGTVARINLDNARHEADLRAAAAELQARLVRA